jgi:branched-chain amino acid transport system permease protein
VSDGGGGAPGQGHGVGGASGQGHGRVGGAPGQGQARVGGAPAGAARVRRATLSSRVGAAAGLVALVVLALGPVWALDSVLRTLVGFLTLLALAQMWNLLAGYAGLVSIGQQAYVGIGAYALLYLADTLELNLFVSVLLAGVVGAVLAVPTAALAFRLRGGYFAIGTWVIAEVYRLVVSNTSQLGGGSGLTLTAASDIDRSTRLYATYLLALGVGAGAVVLSYVLLRRRLGLALTAIRDSETSAQSLGVDVFRTKFAVYVIAAFGCALTGAVVYLNLLRVQPDAAFSVNWTAFMIFIVVIGGVGTIEGPILGAIVFFALQQTLSRYGSWYLILVGAVAVLVTVFAPRGLWGLVADRFGISFFPVRRHLSVPAGPDRPNRADQPDLPDQHGRPGRADRADLPDRPDRAAPTRPAGGPPSRAG